MAKRRTAAGGTVNRSAEFDAWAAPHLAVLRRYAVVLDPVRDPDDLVQDCLERAWTRWETYAPDRGSPRTWLLAVAADRARRRRMRASRLRLVELDPALAPEQQSADWSDRLDVRHAIARLPTRQRQAVLLFYYVDLSVEDVSTAMGCAPGTVKSTLSDARARLATMLEEKS